MELEMKQKGAALSLPKGFKQTEVGVIPEDWGLSILNDLTDITRLAGYEYSTLWEEKSDGEIIALRGFNIGKNRIIERDFVRISDSLSKRLIRSRLFKNDVIYPCVGSIGNAVVIEDDDKYHIQQNIAKITPKKDKAYSHYLAYYLMSEFGLKEIERFNGSSSQPNILVGSLRQYLIITPTLAEQKAIATALSDVDDLISSLDALIAKKKAIKQGAMQQLLTPPSKACAEPGRSSGKRLDGFEGEWVEKNLGDIFTFKTGTSKSKYLTTGGKYIVVDMGSVSIEGKLIGNKRTNYSGDLISKGILIMPKDDIGGGNIIGRTGYIAKNNTYVLSDHVFEMTILNTNNSLFFSYLINSDVVNKSIRKKVSGSAQLGLGKKTIEHHPVIFPIDFEEQKAIAQILSDMDKELEELAAKKEKYEHIKQGMMQELLTGKTRLV